MITSRDILVVLLFVENFIVLRYAMTYSDGEHSPRGEKKIGPRIWHGQHEKILQRWGEQAACYRYMHYAAYTSFKNMNMRMTLPIIVISTVTGTANFAQETFPVSWQEYVPAAIGALNLFAAILTTVMQFLKVSELMESHRVSSVHYGKLSRSIRLELTLPRTERAHDGSPFVDIMRGEYDRLIEQSPPVPSYVVGKFEKKFPEKKDKPETAFSRPEILFVRPIEMFDNRVEKKKTDGVISAFRKRVNDHREAGTLRVPSHSSDQQHASLISELSQLKGLGMVSDRVKNPSALAAVTVESEQPSSPSEIVVEQIAGDRQPEVATPPGNTEMVGLGTERSHP
jgi:hypothetical protein